MVHTPSIVLCATIVFSVASTMAVPIGRLSAREVEVDAAEEKWLKALITGGLGAAGNFITQRVARREEIHERLPEHVEHSPAPAPEHLPDEAHKSQSLGAGIKKIVQGAEKSMKPALEAVKKFGPTVVEGALPLAGFIPFPHSHQNQNQTQQRRSYEFLDDLD